MRHCALLIAFGIITTSLAGALLAADPQPDIQSLMATGAPSWPKGFVSLDGEDSLARLQHSNPRHFAIVRHILAAAAEICASGDQRVIPTRFGAENVGCIQGLWLTSNPPKRELYFSIEGVQYSARVVVPDLGAKLQRAESAAGRRGH